MKTVDKYSPIIYNKLINQTKVGNKMTTIQILQLIIIYAGIASIIITPIVTLYILVFQYKIANYRYEKQKQRKSKVA